MQRKAYSHDPYPGDGGPGGFSNGEKAADGSDPSSSPRHGSSPVAAGGNRAAPLSPGGTFASAGEGSMPVLATFNTERGTFNTERGTLSAAAAAAAAGGVGGGVQSGSGPGSIEHSPTAASGIMSAAATRGSAGEKMSPHSTSPYQHDPYAAAEGTDRRSLTGTTPPDTTFSSSDSGRRAGSLVGNHSVQGAPESVMPRPSQTLGGVGTNSTSNPTTTIGSSDLPVLGSVADSGSQRSPHGPKAPQDGWPVQTHSWDAQHGPTGTFSDDVTLDHFVPVPTVAPEPFPQHTQTSEAKTAALLSFRQQQLMQISDVHDDGSDRVGTGTGLSAAAISGISESMPVLTTATMASHPTGGRTSPSGTFNCLPLRSQGQLANGGGSPSGGSPLPYQQRQRTDLTAVAASLAQHGRSTPDARAAVDIVLNRQPWEKLGLSWGATGLLLHGCKDRSPAAAAGAARCCGMVLSHVNGEVVHTARELTAKVGRLQQVCLRFSPSAPESTGPRVGRRQRRDKERALVSAEEGVPQKVSNATLSSVPESPHSSPPPTSRAETVSSSHSPTWPVPERDQDILRVPPAPPLPAELIDQPPATQMPTVLTVQFKYGRQGFYGCSMVALPAQALVGQYAIVEAAKGVDLGMVVGCSHNVAGQQVRAPQHRYVRVASPPEVMQWMSLKEADEKATDFLQRRARQDGVPVRIHYADFQFDRLKLTVHYVSAESKPDFRQLVSAAFREFRCRIWMNNCQPVGGQPGDALDMAQAQFPSAAAVQPHLQRMQMMAMQHMLSGMQMQAGAVPVTGFPAM
eukprot:TRINITY_DN18481_c0_g1_i1.p1 TRINITY_DN18481_c0_g1~~TRINITY_DN18481_c0_g1_i1.p1  ORF type:complete len:797 (+),score=169.86 TRINITY_DN18481_c0_g1_i1:129-2519(+)